MDELRYAREQVKDGWLGHHRRSNVELWLQQALIEIDRLRNILVFADGLAVVETRRGLADLYAPDCKWAQDTLIRAGCHPRGSDHG